MQNSRIIKIASLILITMGIVAVSCKKIQQKTKTELLENSKHIRGEHKVIAGILSFNNADDLVRQIEYFNGSTDENIIQWSNAISNFTSLNQHYINCDAAADLGQSASASQQISNGTLLDMADVRFAALLNKDGRVIVGDKIYTYNSDKTLTIAPLALLDVQTGVLNTTSGNTEIVDLLPLISCQNFLWPTGVQFLEDDNSTTWAKSNGRPVRALFKKWNMYYYFFSSAGLKINMERKSVLMGWINIQHTLGVSSGILDGRNVYFGLCEELTNIQLLNTSGQTSNSLFHTRYFYSMPCLPPGSVNYKAHKTKGFTTNYAVERNGQVKTYTAWTH
jgi:hypothetical protein